MLVDAGKSVEKRRKHRKHRSKQIYKKRLHISRKFMHNPGRAKKHYFFEAIETMNTISPNLPEQQRWGGGKQVIGIAALSPNG